MANGVFRGINPTDTIVAICGTELPEPIAAENLADINPNFFNNTLTPSNDYCLCTSEMSTDFSVTVSGNEPTACEGYGGSHPTDPPELKIGDDSE